nr:ubiquitin-conjugating enzyme e2 s [Quercus suber]
MNSVCRRLSGAQVFETAKPPLASEKRGQASHRRDASAFMSSQIGRMLALGLHRNSRNLRRLAADHGALYSQPLPPNFLFPVESADNDDLTHLDILLAGPTHTPFAAGVFKLHLSIPPNYPAQPPTAHFRTPIFHPNVDPQTGGVCVETLKRDWDVKLTLKDILLVIQCLLIQPNPDSALNAEAGALLQEDFGSFKRRAELMTSIHAGIPRALREAVREAQSRGQEVQEDQADEVRVLLREPAGQAESTAPVRRRVPTARQRGTAMASRRSEDSPSGNARKPRRQQQHTVSNHVLTTPSSEEDIFGELNARVEEAHGHEPANALGIFEDESTADPNQENEESSSPVKSHAPRFAALRRPPGAPVPLGELTMEDTFDTEDESEAELEYPPSPRKSPSKSAVKRRQHPLPQPHERPESSRDAAARRNPNITPPNITTFPLAQDSPFSSFAAAATDFCTPSPQKHRRQRPSTPGESNAAALLRGALFPILTPKHNSGARGVVKTRSPSSSESTRQLAQRHVELEARLWAACGQDVQRWNRGDFDGQPFATKGGRWKVPQVIKIAHVFGIVVSCEVVLANPFTVMSIGLRTLLVGLLEIFGYGTRSAGPRISRACQ